MPRPPGPRPAAKVAWCWPPPAREPQAGRQRAEVCPRLICNPACAFLPAPHAALPAPWILTCAERPGHASMPTGGSDSAIY